jgi:hypothetical protein
MEIMKSAGPDMGNGAEHIRASARRGQPWRYGGGGLRPALELSLGPSGKFFELREHMAASVLVFSRIPYWISSFSPRMRRSLVSCAAGSRLPRQSRNAFTAAV